MVQAFYDPLMLENRSRDTIRADETEGFSEINARENVIATRSYLLS